MATSDDVKVTFSTPWASEKLNGMTNSSPVLTHRHHSMIPDGTHSQYGGTDNESHIHVAEKSQQYVGGHEGCEPEEEGQGHDQRFKGYENCSGQHDQDSKVCNAHNGYESSSHSNNRQHHNVFPTASRSSGQSDPNGMDGKGDEQEVEVVCKESHNTASSAQSRQRHLAISLILILLCYIMGLLSLMSLQSQYLFFRFAMEFFNVTNITSNQVPCSTDRNSSFQRDIDMIQAKTAHQVLYMDYCQFIPAIFVSLFVGSYADYLGRKYLMFFPLTGAFVKSLIFLLVIYLELDVNYLFLGFAAEGITGSLYVLLLGLSASIADVTATGTQRVLLFALLDISLAIAGAVSQIGTGFLISYLGFSMPALIICCLVFLGCVIVVVYMPETLQKPDHIILNPCFHMRKVFGFYLFDGTRQQRGLYIVGLFFFFFTSMVLLGKEGVELLYLLNSPFCWDSVKIGIFTGIRILVNNLLAILAIKVLAKSIKLEIIGMLGLVSGIASCTVEAFAVNDAMMYISAALAIFIAVIGPISRTLLSRMAPAKSQGALFASVSALQTVCHLFSTTAYNQVYTATLDVFRGAVFMLIVAFLVFAFIFLIVFTFINHRIKIFQENFKAEYYVDADTASPSATNGTLSIRQSSPRDDDDETQPLLQA